MATGASSGQVLAWDSTSKEWKPTTVASASSTIAKDGNSGAGGITLGTNDAEPLTLETNNTPAVTVTSAGNVGIGTTNPMAKLEVGATSGIQLSDSAINHPMTGVISATSFGQIAAGHPTAGGIQIMGFTDVSNQIPNTIAGFHGVADPIDSEPAVRIRAGKSDGADSITDLGAGETVFQVRNNNTSSLTIMGDGDVGIGTTAPARKLHISDAMRLEPIDDPPATPSPGDIYYDSTNALCVWVGASWEVAAGAGACAVGP